MVVLRFLRLGGRGQHKSIPLKNRPTIFRILVDDKEAGPLHASGEGSV